MWWWPFHILVWTHIATGSVGRAAFWVPALARTGAGAHRRWGTVFVASMLATGAVAIAISACTIVDPIGTHPHLPDAVMVRGIFGWMMLYLAILTINLAWYGWLCVLNRTNYARNREWRNLVLQALVTVAAANCAFQGWRIGQPLMLGISIVGFATAATNLHYLYKAKPARNEWLFEHLKGLVGAGISVYTAFFAFGAVRVMPQLALNPILWAVPLTTGLAIIIYYKFDLARKTRQPTYLASAAAQLQR
jgi:hypothetical protein